MNDLANILAPLREYGQKLVRHHAIIAILIVLGLMIFSVLTVSQAMQIPSDETYRGEELAKKTRTRFDPTIIDALEKLQQSDDTTQQPLPSGRINPFTE